MERLTLEEAIKYIKEVAQKNKKIKKRILLLFLTAL